MIILFQALQDYEGTLCLVSHGRDFVTPLVDRSAPLDNQERSWERERDQLEVEISQLQVRQAQLTEVVADEATYADKAKALALSEEQRLLAKTLESKLARWEELCGLIGLS